MKVTSSDHGVIKKIILVHFNFSLTERPYNPHVMLKASIVTSIGVGLNSLLLIPRVSLYMSFRFYTEYKKEYMGVKI